VPFLNKSNNITLILVLILSSTSIFFAFHTHHKFEWTSYNSKEYSKINIESTEVSLCPICSYHSKSIPIQQPSGQVFLNNFFVLEIPKDNFYSLFSLFKKSTRAPPISV